MPLKMDRNTALATYSWQTGGGNFGRTRLNGKPNHPARNNQSGYFILQSQSTRLRPACAMVKMETRLAA